MEQGSRWANIWHTRWTGGGTPTTVQRQAMIDAIAATYRTDQAGANTRYLYYMTNGASLTQIRSTPLDGVTASLVAPYNVTGVQTTDPLPAGAAFVITLRTALRGRSRRGRLYFPSPSEDSNDSTGRPNATPFTASAIAQVEATRIALIAITWELVVASYLLVSAQVVTTVTADRVWDSQRRRNF